MGKRRNRGGGGGGRNTVIPVADPALPVDPYDLNNPLDNPDANTIFGGNQFSGGGSTPPPSPSPAPVRPRPPQPTMTRDKRGNWVPIVTPDISGGDPPDGIASNSVMGHNDWIREYWNNFDPQDIVDEAMKPWLEQDEPRVPYAPDDTFFSPSDDLSQQFNFPDPEPFDAPSIRYQPPAQTSFNLPRGSHSLEYSNYLNNWGGGIQGMFPNFYNAPLASLNYGDTPQGHIFAAGDHTITGDGSAGGASGYAAAPTGPVLDAEAMADANIPVAEDVSNSYATQSRGTSAGTRQSGTSRPANPNLFGVGQNTGQHYFSTDGGKTWKPVGQASADVRWAQNSGTGNYTADQTAKGMAGWNPADSIVNNTRNTGDEGHNIWNAGSGTHGELLEDGSVVPTAGGIDAQRDNRWVLPSQGVSGAMDMSHNNAASAQRYNDWLVANNQWFFNNKGGG